MSAAAARRRKQLLQKKKQQEDLSSSEDPILLRLNSLLSSDEPTEDEAYEALQLVQSQVRRYIKLGEKKKAIDISLKVSTTFLTKKKASVCSQLLSLFSKIVVETNTECSDVLVKNVFDIDILYRDTVEQSDMDKEEKERLLRLHLQFLRRIVRWSAEMSHVRFGNCELQEILAEHCWRMSFLAPPVKEEDNITLDDDDNEKTLVYARSDAMIHFALAEKPNRIIELLSTLPDPTATEEKMGRDGETACERDCLFTRAILVFIAVENLRDANDLIRQYIAFDTSRDIHQLAKSYMDKTDGKAPTHTMFCAMLLRVCEKDRAGPLFQWLLRSFAADLNSLKPDVKSYTTKIGRVYFKIQPPPSMVNMMENMMTMMSGGGMMAKR